MWIDSYTCLSTCWNLCVGIFTTAGVPANKRSHSQGIVHVFMHCLCLSLFLTCFLFKQACADLDIDYKANSIVLKSVKKSHPKGKWCVACVISAWLCSFCNICPLFLHAGLFQMQKVSHCKSLTSWTCIASLCTLSIFVLIGLFLFTCALGNEVGCCILRLLHCKSPTF